MTIELANITFDCDDTLAVANFWSAALDLPLDEGASEYFAALRPTGEGPSWFFIKVPEPRTVKNRVHVDLNATDRAVEIERLIGLGAKLGDDHDEWGHSWTTMWDPEGNEFCIA